MCVREKNETHDVTIFYFLSLWRDCPRWWHYGQSGSYIFWCRAPLLFFLFINNFRFRNRTMEYITWLYGLYVSTYNNKFVLAFNQFSVVLYVCERVQFLSTNDVIDFFFGMNSTFCFVNRNYEVNKIIKLGMREIRLSYLLVPCETEPVFRLVLDLLYALVICFLFFCAHFFYSADGAYWWHSVVGFVVLEVGFCFICVLGNKIVDVNAFLLRIHKRW